MMATGSWAEASFAARMREGRADGVLRTRLPHREAPDVSDDQAPVRTCRRYLSARRDQLQYREELAEGLPIGSGEINARIAMSRSGA